MPSKSTRQPRDRRASRREAPDVIVPNEGTLAMLFDVRRRIILPKRGLVTDSGEALRRMRAGNDVIPDPVPAEPPALR